MDNIKVLVGIITYNPNINRLIENVEAIIDQCNECVICDNGSGNITDIIDAFKEEIVELMKDIPDKSIDMVLCDLPLFETKRIKGLRRQLTK